MEEHSFPAFRRLHGGLHLYHIHAVDRFEELQRIGGRWVLHRVDARTYPERLRVQDMLSCSAPFEVISEAEWAKIRVLVDVAN